MRSNRKVWVAIYVVAFVVFFGGFFAGVDEAYFPIFVGFCMLYGLAVSIYWWRTYRIVRRD